MAQKHAYERRVWVNERQQPPFIFKPPPFQTSRYSIAKTLKSTHCNSISNVIQATSQICQEPHSQLHQQTRVGWCHQAEQGDEQLEGRVADVCRVWTCLHPRTGMIAKADMAGSCPVASESMEWSQFGSCSNDTLAAAKWWNMTWKSCGHSLHPEIPTS